MSPFQKNEMSGLFLLAKPLVIQAQQYTASASLTFAGGLSLSAQNWPKRPKKKRQQASMNPTGLHTTETSQKQGFSSEKSHAAFCFSFCSSKIPLTLLPSKLVEPLRQAIWCIKIYLQISLSNPLTPVFPPID